MEKSELLRSLGFSKEFLTKINEFENADNYEVDQLTFSNENVEISTSDSTELRVKEKQTSSNRLYVTGS